MTRPEWLNDPRIQAAIEREVAKAPARLTPDQLDLLKRTGFFSAPASSAAVPPLPATDRDAAFDGDAKHRRTSGLGGEVAAARREQRALANASAASASPTSRRRATVRAVALQDNAG